MKLVADFHSHTLASDGKKSLEENVEAARQKGIKLLAVTDHDSSHWAGGIKRKTLPQMRQKVDGLNARYAGEIQVLLGLECNLLGMEGQIGLSEEDKPFMDIVLMGFHLSGRPKGRGGFRHFMLKRAMGGRGREYVKKTTEAYIKAIQRHDIDIWVHPGHNIDVDFLPVAEACAQRNTAIEISCRAKHLHIDEQQIVSAKGLGACFAINSDGHTPQEIGCFDQGLAMAKKAGLTPRDIVNAEGYDGLWRYALARRE